MKTTTHTKGPWLYSEEFGEPHVRTPSGLSTVALISTSDSRTAKANAALIASAPELLEALQRMVPEWAYTDLDPQAGDGQVACEVSVGDLRAAIAAIAKATPTPGMNDR